MCGGLPLTASPCAGLLHVPESMRCTLARSMVPVNCLTDEITVWRPSSVPPDGRALLASLLNLSLAVETGEHCRGCRVIRALSSLADEDDVERAIKATSTRFPDGRGR